MCLLAPLFPEFMLSSAGKNGRRPHCRQPQCDSASLRKLEATSRTMIRMHSISADAFEGGTYRLPAHRLLLLSTSLLPHVFIAGIP
jgi:hypothetical protein